MKRIILPVLLVASFQAAVSQTTHTITTPGFFFTPTPLTVSVGDQVTFNVSSIHTATQVAKASWQANSVVPLTSGFDFNASSSNKTITVTTTDTIYYMCKPHGSGGMKGMIVVENPLGITKPTIATSAGVKVFPNPAKGAATIQMPQTYVQSISVLNAQGNEVKTQAINASLVSYSLNIDQLPTGIYQLIIYTGEKKLLSKLVVE